MEAELLQGCIDIADSKPQCVSPITCVPDDSFSESPKFQYEDINSDIKLTRPKDYMILCDIKDGFFPYLSIRTTELCWDFSLSLLTTHGMYFHSDTTVAHFTFQRFSFQ